MPDTLRSAREDALSAAEFSVLWAACRDVLDHLVTGLPYHAGFRIGEVQHLRATWVDWSEGIIRIPPRQLCHCYECTGRRKGIWAPKTRSGVRNLVIVPELEPHLRQMGEAVNRSRQALEQRFERIRRRSSLHRVAYPHCLRGSFATRLAEGGISAASLCYLLGWRSLDTAEAYVQSTMRRRSCQ